VIGIDTNVLVRFLTEDGEGNEVQLAVDAIGNLTPANPGYISNIVLAELWWVLRRSYKYPRDQVCDIFSDMLSSTDLVFDNKAIAQDAILKTRHGADFADALIMLLANEAGAKQTVTLDNGAATKAGMTKLT